MISTDSVPNYIVGIHLSILFHMCSTNKYLFIKLVQAQSYNFGRSKSENKVPHFSDHKAHLKSFNFLKNQMCTL